MTALWAEARRREWLMARAAEWSALAALACLALMLFDPRTFDGVPTWTKPAKFAVSFALWFATFAWLWPALPRWLREGRVGRLAAWAMAVTGAFELAYVAARAALQQASHYNTADAFGLAMYALMGVGATLLVAISAMMGAAILLAGNREWRAAPRLGAGLGLLLGGVLGGAAGWAISIAGTPYIAATASNAAGLVFFGWSVDGGDLRVAHFLGMHAMQALPLSGFALAAVAPRLAVPGVWAVAFAWSALALGALELARAGRSPFA